jgi:hypothetical protein
MSYRVADKIGNDAVNEVKQDQIERRVQRVGISGGPITPSALYD